MPAIEALFIDEVPSPTGTLFVVFDAEANLRAIDWTDYEARMLRLLRLHYGTDGIGYCLRRQALPLASRRAFDAYFAGELRALEHLAVRTNGTEFQREVWRALRTIPPGTTMSYGALAARLGRPKAVRAVGLANGANPIGIVVPCHRVIGANGALTGYGGGLERKRWLLVHEGVLLDL
ncbi:MAG: methylated-DNA--[protein]-cysteine S-methyltransferase [Gammaproteobacteria bacterium]|nr:methylated-DNA--[protein]-cysteine S-methyltransferase [Gammaproteobacteria bacterium]